MTPSVLNWLDRFKATKETSIDRLKHALILLLCIAAVWGLTQDFAAPQYDGSGSIVVYWFSSLLYYVGGVWVLLAKPLIIAFAVLYAVYASFMLCLSVAGKRVRDAQSPWVPTPVQ